MLQQIKTLDVNKDLISIIRPTKDQVYRIKSLNNRKFNNVQILKSFFYILSSQGVDKVDVIYKTNKIIIEFNKGDSLFTIYNVNQF